MSVPQPVTDDTLRVRQLTHYQFSYVPRSPRSDGTFTLQLVLDQGAWEEVLTLGEDDVEPLINLLRTTKAVYYDVQKQTLIFGTAAPGA